MKFDSPLFDKVRVKPDKDRRKKTGGPPCEWAGCKEIATNRAPKGKQNDKDYWRFCLDHAREYNQSYNFFKGMNDADVNALYAKYVKAKEMVGEQAGPGAYGKLLKTINAQAPKIMEQYKAKGVDFQVVVKDNQVVIRAKPKP